VQLQCPNEFVVGYGLDFDEVSRLRSPAAPYEGCEMMNCGASSKHASDLHVYGLVSDSFPRCVCRPTGRCPMWASSGQSAMRTCQIAALTDRIDGGGGNAFCDKIRPCVDA